MFSCYTVSEIKGKFSVVHVQIATLDFNQINSLAIEKRFVCVFICDKYSTYIGRHKTL